VLLERTDQLSALADALDAVIAARAGAVVFVGGEAGAGKTALLRAFCDGRGESTRILWGAREACSLPARSARCSTSWR
jgi:tRNA A37 threonylcarbamoyladenosine biosynthesis protein TsaE